MWRARRRGPRTLSRITDANLDCAFVENALKIGRALAPPVRPPGDNATYSFKHFIITINASCLSYF